MKSERFKTIGRLAYVKLFDWPSWPNAKRSVTTDSGEYKRLFWRFYWRSCGYRFGAVAERFGSIMAKLKDSDIHFMMQMVAMFGVFIGEIIVCVLLRPLSMGEALAVTVISMGMLVFVLSILEELL